VTRRNKDLIARQARELMRWIDRKAARSRGVFAFSGDAECILRLRRAAARRDMDLPGRRVLTGAPVVELHLWNEHMLTFSMNPAAGMGYGNRFLRQMLQSFRGVARALETDPDLKPAQAVGGNLVFLYDPDNPERASLAGRLGFSVFSHPNRAGQVGLFFENLYSWGLMWAYHPASLTGRRFFGARRSEIWMTRGAFLDRYGRPEGS